MVDFQSRDTRRGLGGDDEAEDDEEATEGSAAEAPEAAPDDAAEPVDGEPDGDDPDTESGEATTADAEPTDQSGDPLAAGAANDDGPAADPGDATDAPKEGNVAHPDQMGSTGAAESQAESSAKPPVNSVQAAVVTVGTAGADSDPTGDQVVTALERAGHSVTTRERLRGDRDGIQQSVDALVGRDDVDVVITAGGTGVRAGDVAIEAVHPLLEKALPGFGEAFRTLLFDHIGTGIVAVRSTAGIAQGTLVFCLPGDRQAATLGVEEIVGPEAGDLVAHLE
jgi:molybdenum cofactor biosynthesis protein B